jgi:uncharacterized protein (DUF2062 family)
MKPEETSALKTAGATAVVAGSIAAILGNPVCWAAVFYGTYRMGKAAYQKAKYDGKLKERNQEDDSFWHV